MTPSSHSQKDIDYHNRIGDEYHEVVVDPRKYPNDLLFAEIYSRIASRMRSFPGGGRMLDLGCGTGQMIMRFGARFETVVGVDHSGLMLSEAKRLCSAEEIRPKLIESDLLEFIETDNRTWDLITCVGCLHHLEVADVPLAISRLANRLAPHGQAVLSEPIVVDPGTEPQEIREWNAESVARSKGYRVLVPEPDEAPIELALLKRSFADAGLTVVTEKRGWEVLPRNTPASWWDQLVIRRLQERYGSNGVVYAVLLEKP